MIVMDIVLLAFIVVWFIVGVVMAVLFRTAQYTEIVNLVFLGIMVLFAGVLSISDKARKWFSKKV